MVPKRRLAPPHSETLHRGALILVLLVVAASAFGQDAATVALDPNADLAAALQSSDALTRATASRVALVRDQTALLSRLREALAAEKNATAAREHVRALVLLGSDDDVAFAAAQLPRFPASLDADFAVAVSRLGVPRATALHMKHVLGTRDPAPAATLALWGRADQASDFAAKLLAAGDARGHREALDAVAAARGDAPAVQQTEGKPKAGVHPSQTVKPPAFRLPIALPAGLGEAILKQTRCRDLWIGVVPVTVDSIGRVQSLDVSNVNAERGCERALQTLLRLSLATPDRITSGREAYQMVVKPQGRSVCFDEAAPENRPQLRTIPKSGNLITAPMVSKRVEPRFPPDVIREMGGGSVLIVSEAVITRDGCVRDIRLIRQSPWPVLNSAAVLALSEWQFKPGTLDGVPVDVVFHLSVSFNVR